MSNLKDTDGIEQQYTEHPYPDPIFDMFDRIQTGYRQGSCPEAHWHKLFPEKTYRDDLNVLIAGCGTNQAVYHALKFPNSHHYAIDVSDESLSKELMALGKITPVDESKTQNRSVGLKTSDKPAPKKRAAKKRKA